VFNIPLDTSHVLSKTIFQANHSTGAETQFSVIFVNENANGEKRENNKFVNKN